MSKAASFTLAVAITHERGAGSAALPSWTQFPLLAPRFNAVNGDFLFDPLSLCVPAGVQG
jgi:hypothetical protein